MINFAVTGGGALASGSVANTYQGYADKINTKEGFNVLSFMSSHDETLTVAMRTQCFTMRLHSSFSRAEFRFSTVTKPPSSLSRRCI